MSPEGALLGVAAALGSGLLIGIERERRKGTGPHRAFAGVRTFSLAALAGAACELSGYRLLVVAGASLVVALAAVSRWRERSRDPGVTTEVALFLTYVIGVIAITRPVLAGAGGVLVALLLASRVRLHRFAVAVLSPAELRDGLLLCGAALVVLPLLPERGPAWLPALSPRRIWGLVVIFMGLQGLGYVALRVGGARLGLALSGLVSGFVSSTATIAALGGRARSSPALRGACVCGALFSSVATVVLLAVVAATVSTAGLRALAPSLTAALLAALIVSGLSLRRSAAATEESVGRGRAFNFWYAIGFALLLTGLTAVMNYLSGRFGHGGLIAGAALAGFFDAHAAATSVLSVGRDLPEQTTPLLAVLVAFTTNTASKVAAAFGAGGVRYAVPVAGGLLVIAAALWAPLLLRAT